MVEALFACCSGSVGGAVAVFDVTAFRLAYPMFASVTDDQLQAMFDLAGIYLRNDGSGLVRQVSVQTTLMYLLTAHLAQMTFGTNGSGASGIVGRITSASEGSVSVSSDYPTTPSNAWFLQTPFGASFWQATAAYRTARYIPGPTRFGTGIGRNRGFR